MENDDNTIVLTNIDGTTSTYKLNNIIDTSDNITIDLNQSYGATTTYLADGYDPSSVTIGDGVFSVSTITGDWSTNDTIQIGDINLDYNNIIFEKTIFQDCMPELNDVEGMCKEYPALNKAYENFKTIYKMVEQDYKGKKEAGELDE